MSRTIALRNLGMGAVVALMAITLSLAPQASGQVTEEPTAQPAPTPRPEDGPSYPINAFLPGYMRLHDGQPSIDSILQIEVMLGLTAEGYVAPRGDVPVVVLRLADLPERPVETYYASAIQTVLVAIRDFLVEKELMGVFVAPDPQDLNEVGADLRGVDDATFGIVLTTGIVTELRTLASGERLDSRDRINHPLHERIRRRSPVRPLDETEAVDASLLRKDLLDRYVYHLSRHPGRSVDVSVAAALEPGGVALDYIITENRPLVLYAQISNTGTKQTDRVRERFGLLHTQFTDNDDILSFDFITAGFDDDANAVVGSYEAPFGENDRIRWKIFGNWSEFTADQVGFFDDDFIGESWEIGGQVLVNIHQRRELFIDLVAGLRFLDVEVDNRAFAIRGEENFILPSIGLRLDRLTDWFSTQAFTRIEWNVASVDNAEITALGRTAPDDDWVTLQVGLSHSFYLEPALNREAWEDPSTPESSTLAHEISIDLFGQYAFNNRLVPQAESVAGGMFTVRGHPESAVAGDNVFVGRFEYRYHVPRAFSIEAEPRELFGEPFRTAPQFVYGRPDWDLVLKGFFDVGRVTISDRLPFEDNETLLGAGIGLNFVYRRNFNLRLDWGFALRDVDSARVNSGSNRLHVLGTILF